MNRTAILLFQSTLLLACGQSGSSSHPAPHHGNAVPSTADSAPSRVGQIALPAGYTRVTAATGSFAAWLRNVGLKKSNTVYLYNGQPKRYQGAQAAVLDIPVGSRDLQQCADAVMRLRAEYLFSRQQYADIVFYDNGKQRYAFTAPYTRANFEKFLERVFGMCGSASLEKQLRPVARFSDLQAGDVLIRGGFPGHAEIVMDVAQDKKGNKIYLLAQSYMPAQDIHILKNPADADSPWYDATTDDDLIMTPEYKFFKSQLRRW